LGLPPGRPDEAGFSTIRTNHGTGQIRILPGIKAIFYEKKRHPITLKLNIRLENSAQMAFSDR